MRHRNRAPVDVAALIVGLAAVGLAAGVLVNSLAGPLDHHLITIGAPVGLVVLGVIGLALNRGPSD